MNKLMMTAAALAFATPLMAQDAATPPATDAMPADGMATDASAMGMAVTAENPGISANWFEGRDIYTTNQPSDTGFADDADFGTVRPDDWSEIGQIDNVVLSADGQVIGYTADIGGFLGLGERRILISPDMVRLVDYDDAVLWGDETVFVTNFTQEELEAMPQIEDETVLDD